MPDTPNAASVGWLDPVDRIPTDPLGDAPVAGTALCLSGGGYRAMLFHLGALWRMNELGLLPKLDKVSSVSGGSITAGVLGLKWSRLGFDSKGVATQFQNEVVAPIRGLASTTIDWVSILEGLFGPWLITRGIMRAYRRHLFGRATLQDLPDRPRFVFNSTNVQSSALWRFSKAYLWDYRVGRIDNPRTPLAVAVAASSAFPPFLSPVVLRFKPSDFVPGTGTDLERPPFTTKVVLTDGGVYDNLGLETAWKTYQTILSSDAGETLREQPQPRLDWAEHVYRAINIIREQVGSLRKRDLINSYVVGRRSGAYWGVASDISHYDTPGALACPAEKTVLLAHVPTRLAGLEPILQERLINWGYAIADAALRKHYDASLPAPAGFAYPAAGIG